MLPEAPADVKMVSEGRWRAEAVNLLRRFYLTENTKAPQPKSKAKRVFKEFQTYEKDE